MQRDWWDSIDMADARHPQTLIAHSMNGGELPVSFGGPLRLRKQFGAGLGSASPEGGYAWYAGI